MVGVGLVTQGQVEVVLTHCPDHAIVDQPFPVQLQVRNLLQRRVQLRLQWRKEKMGPLLPFHDTSVALGFVEARSQCDVTVMLLPLAPGIHKLSGLRVSCPDPSMKLQVDFDQLHELLVCKSRTDSAESLK